jgi:carboxyl-terminal processing protease
MKCRLKYVVVSTVALVVLFSQNSFALTEQGFKSLHTFTKVLTYLEESYVDPIDDDKVVKGAIRGMLMTLDPHTIYMSPEVFKELRVDTSGRFDGVGIEVTVRDGILTVVAPIKDSPADKAGVEPGDKIIKIDGQRTDNMPLSEAVHKMRGKRGSKVVLTLVRQDAKQSFDVTLIRQKINVPSVKSEVLDSRYGYIAITSFQEDTAKSLKKAIKDLEKKNALNGLVLDLRKNPGGLLDQAVDVSNIFLKSGTIVTTESRGQLVDKREVSPEGEKVDCPLVVLVDGGSASASEIVAGALQDNKRAMLLGARTFGKGSVQTVIELDDGSALKLTVARYFTPSGRSIQAHGITPDIEVPAEAPKVEVKKKRLREEMLPGHLEIPEEKPVEKEAEGLLKDYRVRVALDYLKSWDTFQGQTMKKEEKTE